MDLNFIFFELGPVLKLVFRLNYIPKPEDFKELTPSQYAAFYAQATEQDIKELENKRLMAFIPDEPAIYHRVLEVLGDEFFVISEDQLSMFEKTSSLIEHLIERNGRDDLDTMSKKLGYIAAILPKEFANGTPYGVQSVMGKEG